MGHNFFWGGAERENEHAYTPHGLRGGAEEETESEAGSALNVEPNLGLDPMTLDHDLS